MRAKFTEEWFSDDSCLVLGNLYRSVKDLSGAVIEVGCWQGRSTCALANAAHPEIVHAVDTWVGSPGEISADLAAGRDVFAEFNHNVKVLTHGNVETHRMGWREFFDGYTSRVKFIHIDAEHTYSEVSENIEAVLPLMVPCGVICGDDAHHEPVRQAVLDTLGDGFVSASLWIWRAL
jgi:predicted O-methyltransferase YrrM